MNRKVIRWEDPPRSMNSGNRGGRPPNSDWNPVAEQLRDEPKRWAVVYIGHRTMAMSVRSKISEARAVCFRPHGDFEAAVRAHNGVHTVYARYVGEEFGWAG